MPLEPSSTPDPAMAPQGWNQNCQEGQPIGKEGTRIGSHFKCSGSASIWVQTNVQDFTFIAHVHQVPAPVGPGARACITGGRSSGAPAPLFRDSGSRPGICAHVSLSETGSQYWTETCKSAPSANSRGLGRRYRPGMEPRASVCRHAPGPLRL